MSRDVTEEMKQRLTRAVLAMQKMQARIDTLEQARTEPIAIVGMGCRFPGGADTPEAYWELLSQGRDAVRREPASRRAGQDSGAVRWGGYLDDVSGFDAAFFGISPREADSMDPRQRLLLEVAWEALEHAGQDPLRLVDSSTGVFVGVTGDDYWRLLANDASRLDPYCATGNGHCFPPGRISYALGLRGPSLAVDTACSSSLVAVHLACQSLRSGECDVALAGGANLVLDPAVTETLERMGALSPNGRCSVFDARANGFVRGEGCGLVVLKRLSDARAHGDDILAVIRGSAVNQDGRSQGLTAPNGLAQQALLRQALASAKVAPSALGLVEAHGTGTSLGDPIEFEALAGVLGKPRPDGSRCALGSVKTNLGHLEAAAGIAGLMKAVLALRHEAIPRHLNFSRLNPRIRMEDTAFFIPTEAQPWPRSAAPRFAGISAMGMSGTNAHVILEEGPPAPASKPSTRPVQVLTLSARSEEALVAMARGYAAHLTGHPALDAADVCFTTNTTRARLPHRLAVTGSSVQALASGLTAFASGEKPEAVARGTAGHAAPKVAFLFTGQGAQFAGMGRKLYETSPVFREALDRCAARLKPHVDLLAVLYPAEGARSPIDQTAYSQPALFALEYALAEVWRAWGVVPDVVMGHSVGELAAACVAGYLSLEDALELVAERGRLMQALPPGGAMATVFAPEAQVAPLLARYGEHVSIAAYNSPGQLTLSGAAEPLGLLTAELEARGVLVRRLNVSHAFHSPLMEPMLAALDAKAAKVAWTTGRVPLVSNVTGQPVGVEALSAPGYWRRHAREAVHFQQGMESLRGLGVDFFLEVGPHTTLLELGKACLGPEAGWRASLRKNRDDVEHLLGGLGHLFARGYELDWSKVDPEPARRKVVLPRYPWQRQRHWALGDGAPSLPVASPKPEAGAKGELYTVEWEPLARRTAAREGTWLLLCDAGGVGARLAEGMEARGMRCVTVSAGTEELPWREEPYAGVVYLRSLDVTGAEGTGPRDACLGVASLLRAPESTGRLWLVTRGALEAQPAQATLWGLGRVVALEAPERWGGLIDLGPEDGAEALLEELCAADGEDQVVLRGRERYVARLAEREAPEARPVQVHAEATYLITGGQGALGLDVARWLVRQGARHLVLSARSEFPARERWDALEAQGGELGGRVATVRELERLGATVLLARADVSRQESMAALLTRIRSELPPLRGIVHAAAVGSSARVRELDAETLDGMLAPKVAGAWNLHMLTQEDPLDFFVLFSSIAGVWGSEGLGHYAAANAFLDALAAHRHARGQVAASVGWGPWMGTGLATAEQRRWLESVGVDALERDAALGWMERLLGARLPQAVVASLRWERFRSILEARGPRPLLTRLSAGTARASTPTAWSGDLEALRSLVERTVVHTLGLERGRALEPERGFSELGMSSIMAVDLKGQLEGALGLTLPATLAFNFPNVAALTEHLATRLAAQAAPSAAPEASRQERADDPIAIVGMACRLPGGAETPEAFWELLREGRDAISEVPPDRWDLSAWYNADPSVPGKMHVRAGGFLREVDRFEPGFFGISPREAESLDPQQRLMLEVAWEALERAGQNPSALRDSRTGVFVGISSSDYGRVMSQGAPEDMGAWFASGSALSMAAGRLSYTLGLRGPSLSVDTACSSSLVALHLACQSLRSGESELALAAGVNLILSPEPVVAASKARMLSPDGRCKTFDASANGFARAEGCGVLVLKRLSEAQARGDTVLAVIRGTAVNHDGPSSGLTVPNGPAQQAVIRDALRDAAVSPREVSYLEAHGTGTSLGDPIEAEAMWAVLKEGRQDESLWMGSVKTNLGHLESAAGVAGVMKVVLAMQRKQLPAHLHLEKPSPHIDWKGMGVKVPTVLMDWAPSQGRRIAGVSSFGFSGTNAHVVLEEAPTRPERRAEAEREHVLMLSARSEEALSQQVTRYRQWLETSQEPVEDVCFTAAVGRAHFEHRVAVVARGREELTRKLKALEAEGVVRGRVDGEGAAARYVRGEPVDFGAQAGRRVPLPTYPFQRQRYWWRGSPRRTEAGGKPHLGRRLRSPALDALVYETAYSASGPSHLDDHRLFGTMVAAGSSHVSLALAAVEDAHGSVACTVEDMVFRQALVLREDETRTVQFIATSGTEGSAFEVKSLDGGTWVTHSAGRVRVGQVEAQGPVPSLAALQARFRERRPGDDLYRRMHEGGYILGTSYRWVHEVARDGDELLGELRPPANPEGLEDYPLHPGFVDSCFQVLGGWSLDPSAWADGDLIVPFSIARFTVYRRPRGTVWCHARIDGGGDVRAENSLGGDLRLFDADGLVAEIHGFRGRLASRDSVLRGMQPSQGAARYERSWRPGPAALPARPVADTRPWVLLEDAQGVGDRLARMLEAAGASVLRVRQGSGFWRLGAGSFELDARDFARGWTEAVGPTGCAGVVYLWGLDQRPAEGASAEAVQRAALEASGGALNLVKALVGQGGAPAPLWLVTRGAWAVEPSSAPLALAQSVLWGLGRVMDLEHPGLRCTRVDLDPRELERSVQLLCAELGRGEDSPVREVAFRAGTCLYPVLREAVGPRGDAIPVRPDATYLITGGLGGLGLETARWLVEQGARSLVLVGRRAPTAQASEAVRALEGAGARVSVASVDVSREEEVSALLRRMDAELPPLRGIIHAAGVLDDGALARQDLERFERVMAPKVAGAWNLHRLTEGRPLDFFVLFSSASATLGSAGQGNYAAANAFLDALAEQRRARGQVAQSLGWGPWAETGMVGAADGPLARELERRGVRPLPTREALTLLGDALTRDGAGGVLLSIQWPVYLRGLGALARSTLYEAVAPAAPREAGAQAQPRALLAERLQAAVPHERQEVLARSLQEEVARVLRLPPGEPGRQQEFADVGMDSLMAIELRDALQKELGRSIPVTAALEYRTVEALARYLLDEVVKDAPPQEPRAAPRQTPEAVLEEELSRLSDAELARLVAEDLAKDS